MAGAAPLRVYAYSWDVHIGVAKSPTDSFSPDLMPKPLQQAEIGHQPMVEVAIQFQ
jgi:hypothetical protein